MKPVFEPPGPGQWGQDSTHFPRPVTAYVFDVFRDSFIKGFAEGTARYGLPLSHLDLARVNGFLYSRGVSAAETDDDPDAMPRRFAAAKTAIESKLWRADIERWDGEIKPDSIRRNLALQSVAVGELDNGGLSGYLDEVRSNAMEMVYRHHIFTIPCLVPIGLYLASVSEWAGIDVGRVLTTLRGSSPVSCGAIGELQRVGQALSSHGISAADFSSTHSAQQILDHLCARGDEVSEAIEAYLAVVGFKLVSGYDIADPCAIEMPEVLLKVLWASLHTATDPTGGAGEEATESLRAAVPAQHRQQFDELLADARLVNRLRDERGVYNDQWGTGIARRAILEAGRRLAGAGRIGSFEMAVELTHEEMISMLAGGPGPEPKEVAERWATRRGSTLEGVPATLGPPEPPPPPLDQLPEHAQIVTRAVGTVIAELAAPEDDTAESFIHGRAVSPGVYEGTARVVLDATGFEGLSEGEVLVTQATSPSFNVLLPLLGAIVTDRGGQLSHAAIVAREYGVPAVVGTRTATSRIADGDRIRVDGGSGRVDIL